MTCPEGYDYKGPPLMSVDDDSQLLREAFQDQIGPFFIVDSEKEISDTDLKIIAKMDSEPEEAVFSLMASLQLLTNPDELTSEPQGDQTAEYARQIYERVVSMGAYYRQHYWSNPENNLSQNKQKVNELRSATREYDEYPLLRYANRMTFLFPGRRNNDVEGIIRLLLLDDLRNFR